MLVRILAIVCLLVSATAATAQVTAPQETSPAPVPSPPAASPPQPSEPSQEQPPGRVFCQQNVTYRLADRSSVPEQYRGFVGVWSDAAWDSKTCAALVVQEIKPDGAASIIYVYGPQGSNSTVAGAVLHGTGVIRGDQLRFQNSDGSQYAFRPGLVDMVGHWINPNGESFQATFKATP